MPSGRWRPGNWGLATRVAAAAAVLLVVLLAIVVISYREALDERRDAEVANAANTGRAVAGIIDGFAADLESSLLAIAIAIGEQEGAIDQDAAGPYLRTMARHYQILRAIFVTDLEGRVLAADSGAGVGTDLAERPYMQGLRAGATSVWGPGVAGLESGEVTATYGRLVTGPEGEPRAYLIAAFYPRRLNERLVGRVADDADVTVVDQTGTVLFSSQRPDLPLGERDLSGSGRVQAALAGSVVEVDGNAAFFGDERRFGVVVPVPSAGWAVAYTRPLSVLEATLFRRFLAQAVQVGGAVLLVGALLTLATRRIVRPLDDLAGAASAVARGERPAMPPASGTAEVRQLAAALGTMSAAVAQREDELRRESERRRTLADASRAFAEAGLDLERELATIARRVSESVGDGCAVLLMSDDQRVLLPAAMHHRSAEQLERARSILAVNPITVGEGLIGEVAKTGEPVLIRNLNANEILNSADLRLRVHLEHFALASLTIVPLRVRGRVIGVLAAWRGADVPAYEEADVALLAQIADRAALGIDNARLYREAAEHAAAVDRAMRAHDEAVALLAHDLRNPLTTISATAQSVRRQVQRGRAIEPERLANEMQTIEAAITRALHEIEKSLDLAQAQTGRPLALERAPVDLVDMLRDICAEHQRQTDRHRIVVLSEDEEIVGQWDAARLERAFGNLLNNAIKYSPDGGTVTASLWREQSDSGDWAAVSVRDEGMGIPPAAVYRIFDRFFRAENVAERVSGTGLGLSGVRYIVEAHAGSVDVESIEGEGSTFTVHLPLTAVPDGPPSG